MKSLKYAFGICFPVLGIILIVLGIISYAYSQNIVIAATLIVAGIVLIMAFKGMRIKGRQECSFDKYGNSVKKYSSLSQAERKTIDMTVMARNESIMSEAEFNAMLNTGGKNPDKELKSLIGLDKVKEQIEELKAQMQYADKKAIKNFHLVFLGNPGTGKTTVARIYTGFLYKYKYIKKNEYICTDASTLMASGSSEKMRLILSKAHGRVLFIDEAYALSYDASGLGQQILAMLINEMENSRNNMIVILAGYKESMRILFQMNEGLSSRINSFIFFEDYDHNELGAILTSMAKKDGYTIEQNTYDHMVNILLYKKCLPNFANARTVRKLYERTLQKHYLNLSKKILGKEYRFTLVDEDVVEDDTEDSYLG